MADLDPGIYNQLNKPASPIETVGQYAGVANALQQNQLLQQQVPIAQQHLEQARIETEKLQGQQHIAQLVGQFTGENGKLDALAFKHAAAKDPIAARNWDVVSNIADPMLEEEQFGVTPSGAPNMMTAGQAQVERDTKSHPKGAGQPVTTVVPQGEPKPVQLEGAEEPAPKATGAPSGTGAPGYAGDIAPGFKENVADYHTEYKNTQDAANDASVKKAALSNVYDLSKSGAPSGQKIGAFYTLLSQYGLAPAGAQTAAEQLQLIKDHSAQIATATGSRSDQDLLAHQLANINEDDLPAVIQHMVPYLKGVEDAKIAKASYYRKQDPSGIDAKKIAGAQGFWQQHADPRIWELKELQKADPAAFKARAKEFQKEEAMELAKRSKALHGAGALNNE